MKTLAILLLFLISHGVTADVIYPCPTGTARCTAPIYIWSRGVSVIWWNGFYCRVLGKPDPTYYPCKPYYVNGALVGWWIPAVIVRR